jgi:Bacterial regulatory helix-turn-helix protein, lysR family
MMLSLRPEESSSVGHLKKQEDCAHAFKAGAKTREAHMGMIEDVILSARVVEKGSFSAAGRELRLSVAVVSHRIRTLEKRLGAHLS